jgi:hypothetical protein
LNWVTISGWFTADSAYEYIIIGNFFDNIQTDTVRIFQPNCDAYAYYYVDDICVSLDSSKCTCILGNTVENQSATTDIRIINDGSQAFVVINRNDIKNISFLLYDIFGNEVKKIENIEERKIRINKDNLASGVYFLKINYLDRIFVQKIILTN